MATGADAGNNVCRHFGTEMIATMTFSTTPPLNVYC
jgi:hypothetical protein